MVERPRGCCACEIMTNWQEVNEYIAETSAIRSHATTRHAYYMPPQCCQVYTSQNSSLLRLVGCLAGTETRLGNLKRRTHWSRIQNKLGQHSAGRHRATDSNWRRKP